MSTGTGVPVTQRFRRTVVRRARRTYIRYRRRRRGGAGAWLTEAGAGWRAERSHKTFVIAADEPEPRRGVYLRGACDMPCMFTMAPLVARDPHGTLCIHTSSSGVSDARADLLLQTARNIPEEHVAEARAQLGLPDDYFAPTLFEPTFTVLGRPDLGRFPKSVVVLSILPEVNRSLYRHREHGFLVDPGGWWLNNKMDALANLSRTNWVREQFEPVGRVTVDDLRRNYRELIPMIRERTGAEVLVFNTLSIEPGDTTHDYGARSFSSAARRRELVLAMFELSDELGFHVVDVDRVLKTIGVHRQVDFSHFPLESMQAVGQEAHGILESIGIV
jgi:hypothetical protein